MRFTLKEYQSEAVRQILKALGRGRRDWHEDGDRTAFALSATTGSGKTVIAATAIEALLHGSDEFDVEADRTAVVLWISKDPALNEQTRGRFIECADRIPPGDLVLLDKTFPEDSLQSGTVYFINPDKLGRNADFVKHTDARQVTFWQLLANTVGDPAKTLYLVLDEAHEGMKAPSRDERTIVQKIINGNGANPPAPIVWGISATVRRFDEAMARTADIRAKLPNITIDPVAVQDSGLLKNALTLDIPDEPGDFETAMVRDATLDFVRVCERWDAYAGREGLEKPVVPLLVVQIPNKAEGERNTEKGRQDENASILRVLETIRGHWPDLPADGVAHVLGDRATLEIGAYKIPRVAPQDVQHDERVRVLLAKDAISTGWDCPRAEVLVSLRPGKDHTYVTQLLGRMVRTPLAQSTSDDRLNAAACYLPRFDAATAKIVAEEIMGMREPGNGPSGPAIPRVLLRPVLLGWNPDVPGEVRALIESLPSYARPTAVPRPIKRLLKASQAFGQDGLVPNADKEAHEMFWGVLDTLATRHAGLVEAKAHDIRTADVRRITAERGATAVGYTSTQRDADAATVDDALRHVRRMLSAAVVNRYLSRNAQAAITAAYADGEDPGQVDITGLRAQVAALGLIETPDGEPSVPEAVENAADTLVRYWLTTKAGGIDALPDARRPTYEAIRQMAREPEPVPIRIRTEEQADTVDTDRVPLPTARRHVLSDPDGRYPLDVKLNRWERAVIAQETGPDTGIVGWYRNPSAAGENSLRVPYRDGTAWKSVQPDVIVVRRDTAGTLRASIIDPHGAHLGDASPKLRALAEYADHHADRFERILALGIEKKAGDQQVLIGLDLKDAGVRRAVYEAPADADSLKALYERHGTVYGVVPA
ncbi:DEAD/DEAH box helicase [Actinoplanes sp. NPDC051494]|uniref:DEAD/DEAH box helicase n=1 Tax=Actinoplanes sp. NPDC051494 TaxID=3363907 RepID=UPI0037BDAC65